MPICGRCSLARVSRMKTILTVLAVFACTLAPDQSRARSDVPKYCKADLQRFCKDVRAGSSRLLQCLKTNHRLLSPECAQALQKLKP
ncbi:cysteine rich repeat-containing protein [Chelatococcus asaccharovorans]|nr:cysteine rich repeat-containing protein [Chelatococcus asaccharovorans]